MTIQPQKIMALMDTVNAINRGLGQEHRKYVVLDQSSGWTFREQPDNPDVIVIEGGPRSFLPTLKGELEKLGYQPSRQGDTLWVDPSK